MAAISRMATRFQAAVPEQTLDALEEEVLDYKLAPSSSMPTTTDLCSYWQGVGEMCGLDGTSRFPHFTKLAVLALPVSNADTERVFSIVKKIVTSYRTDLERRTLCALVSCKPLTAIAKELLKSAKGASMDYS
jgi:hypothetical protein